MVTEYLKDFAIDKMKEVLISGGLIAFPTDTVFGLACIYDDKEAIRKVKAIKGRDENKPLPMMCNGLEMIMKVAYVDKRSERLIKTFTPGPLTIIFNKKAIIDDYVTNGFKTIGIRVPNNKEILELIKALAKPILVTSANVSGEPSIKEYLKVKEIFDTKIEMIIEKDAKSDVASTIVDVSGDDIKILREGLIKEEELKEVYYEG